MAKHRTRKVRRLADVVDRSTLEPARWQRQKEWLSVAWRSMGWRHVGLLVLALLVAMLFTGWPLGALGYRLQLTESGPRGVYQFVEGPISRGDWVAVCLPSDVARLGVERGYLGAGVCASGARPVLKRVVGLGGDRVEVRDRVWVEGQSLAGSVRQHLDSLGRPVPAISEGTYVLAEGELWLATPALDGWDSRYFGAVRRDLALAVAEPRLLID